MIAWFALWKYPLRTVLTLLSLTVGIAALPASLAIATGAVAIVQAHLETWGGANTFGIKVDRRIENGRGHYILNPERLTLEDVRALEAECPSITLAMPETLRRHPIRANGKAIWVGCQATVEFFQEAQNWFVEKGRFLSASDVKGARKVCVIGQDVWTELFANQDPIGEYLHLGHDEYRIVGIMEKRGTASLWKGVDRRIWLPITTAFQRLYGDARVTEIWIKTIGEDAISQAVKEAETVLRKRHRNRKFFRFWYMPSGQWLPNSLSRALNRDLLGTIAIGSLLIAWIGMVNVSTASVHHRRREIGLRKAIGATRKAILAQFLFESLFLCLIGVPMGILMSLGLLRGLRIFVEHTIVTGTSWPVSILPEHLGLGGVIGIVVVFFANLYPIWKAVRVPPIVSLKNE